MLDRFRRFLFPPRCAFCRTLLADDERYLCTACSQKNYAISRPKAYSGAFYAAALSAFVYEGEVRQILHRLKFHGGVHLAEFFASRMADKLGSAGWEFDLIVPVPSHFYRRYKKGYDHARLLAQELSRFTGAECAPLLKKVRRTKPMYGLHKAQRRANIIGSVTCTKPVDARHRRVLLVDDIITTGCTAAECARVLRDYGAETVYVITAAGVK